MQPLVMKFGGAAVATTAQFPRIADIILKKREQHSKIVVVVSAMAHTTDRLIEMAKEIHPNPPRREYDMLVTVGERISIALLAMALSARGHEAISFTGSQTGIITCSEHSEARIIDVKPHRLLPHLSDGTIVIVAGFQGVSQKGEITTFGRGGSDTTAVALAAALDAEKVIFYKDVEGIYNLDPKLYQEARLYQHLTYDEAHRICCDGAKVLHPRSIVLAKNNRIPLHVKGFHHIDKNQHGTIIFDNDQPKLMMPVYEHFSHLECTK